MQTIIFILCLATFAMNMIMLLDKDEQNNDDNDD